MTPIQRFTLFVIYILSIYSFQDNIPAVYSLRDNISLWNLELSSYFLKDIYLLSQIGIWVS